MSDDVPLGLFAVIAFFAALIIGIVIGWNAAMEDAHRSAVEAGVGEFQVVDESNGDSAFRWRRELVKP